MAPAPGLSKHGWPLDGGKDSRLPCLFLLAPCRSPRWVPAHIWQHDPRAPDTPSRRARLVGSTRGRLLSRPPTRRSEPRHSCQPPLPPRRGAPSSHGPSWPGLPVPAHPSPWWPPSCAAVAPSPPSPPPTSLQRGKRIAAAAKASGCGSRRAGGRKTGRKGDSRRPSRPKPLRF